MTGRRTIATPADCSKRHYKQRLTAGPARVADSSACPACMPMSSRAAFSLFSYAKRVSQPASSPGPPAEFSSFRRLSHRNAPPRDDSLCPACA